MNDKKVSNIKKENLANSWSRLDKVSFDYQNLDGKWGTQTREIFHKGNGATILLYNKENKTIILTRQFRLPTYLNGNDSGMMIESCAGLLDEDNPLDCIIRETEEETGYKIKSAQKIMECYMTPGAVTEYMYFFVSEYTQSMKVSEGGGLAEEQEDIEVLEMKFQEVVEKMKNGVIKDAKTILLIQYAIIHNLLGV